MDNSYNYYEVDILWDDLDTGKKYNSIIVVNAKSEKQIKFLACKITEQREELEKGLKVIKFNSIKKVRLYRRIYFNKGQLQ